MKQEHYQSLELCKKLTEAWFPDTEYKPTQYLNSEFNEYVCPSIMELLDELRKLKLFKYIKIITLIDLECEIEIWFSNGDYQILNWDTIPNALAEMWLWLRK